MQRSLFALVIAFALILGACAGTQDTATQQTGDVGGEQPSSTIDDTASAEAPSSSEAPEAPDSDPMPSDTESSDDTEAPASTNPPPEGPVAPDFTLALGADGSETFMLSQEAKPVFMVFWAEW